MEDEVQLAAVCSACGKVASEWCEYPWGPLCLRCDNDEATEPTPLEQQHDLGGEGG